MVRHRDQSLADFDWWSLASSRIMPSLEDLHYAIRLKDIRKVKMLTSHSSIRIDSSLRSCTALSLAVQEGSLEMVQMLLDTGRANVNKLSCDSNGRLETPLFTACRLGYKAIAKLLVDYGADVNTVDFYMHSPLWIATRERSPDLSEFLIDNGAYLNTVDKFSQCPLYLATKYTGRAQIAKRLIGHGCKLDLTDAEGRGALFWTFVNKQYDVFKMLIDAGAHMNRKTKEFICQHRNIIEDDTEIGTDFKNWLENRVKNPQSLMRLAANCVRNRLSLATGGKSIWTFVDMLNVPKKVERDLKLVQEEELVIIESEWQFFPAFL